MNPDETGRTLRLILAASASVRSQIDLAFAYNSQDMLAEAFSLMERLVADFVWIVSHATFDAQPSETAMGAKFRRPVGFTKEQLLVNLDQAIRFYKTSIKDYMDMPETMPMEIQERRGDLGDDAIMAMGNYARATKRIIQERWNGWTEELESKYRRYLKLYRPKRD
jgi:hypothetical protein